MNDKIREVALRVGNQMKKEIPPDSATDDDIAVEFVTRCLQELSKDVEPVGVFADVNSLTPERGTRWEQMSDDAYDPKEGYVYLYANTPLTEQDKLDAARYRWLRDIGQDKVEVFFATDKNTSGWGVWDSHDDKDAAIDRAMENGK